MVPHLEGAEGPQGGHIILHQLIAIMTCIGHLHQRGWCHRCGQGGRRAGLGRGRQGGRQGGRRTGLGLGRSGRRGGRQDGGRTGLGLGRSGRQGGRKGPVWLMLRLLQCWAPAHR